METDCKSSFSGCLLKAGTDQGENEDCELDSEAYSSLLNRAIEEHREKELFGGAYIIPHFEGSCLYFSTFPDIFILAFIGFSRCDPHYSCGKFE